MLLSNRASGHLPDGRRRDAGDEGRGCCGGVGGGGVELELVVQAGHVHDPADRAGQRDHDAELGVAGGGLALDGQQARRVAQSQKVVRVKSAASGTRTGGPVCCWLVIAVSDRADTARAVCQRCPAGACGTSAERTLRDPRLPGTKTSERPGYARVQGKLAGSWPTGAAYATLKKEFEQCGDHWVAKDQTVA